MKYKVLKRFVIPLGIGDSALFQKGDSFDTSTIGHMYRNFLAEEGYIEEIKEEKSVVFVPREGQKYFYMNYSTDVDYTTYCKDDFQDVRRVAIGNCYETESNCIFAIEKAKVIRELEVLANFKPDWSDFRQVKYYIQYDRCNGVLTNCNNHAIESQGLIFFRSVDELNHVVQQIGEDRILKYLFGIEKC